MIIPFGRRALPIAVATLAAIGGAIAAVYYHRLDLTLSHYDARGHLVVARRIFDSITPGWQQIGAVWLPLPQLLNAIPVQVDTFYRNGASAVAMSVVSFAIAAGAIASLVLSLTESAPAALVAAAVFAFNPNVVYLQATPMTEPLLLALTTLALAMLIEWCRDHARTMVVGCVFTLACLTRYEAWPLTYSALAAAVWALWRRGEPFDVALRRVGRIAIYPTVTIAVFAIFSRVVIGQWLVTSGFFVPENKALEKPLLAAAEIWWGTRQLSGSLLMPVVAAGLIALVAASVFNRRRADAALALSLLATAAVPWLAFVNGHPFRIRYMVPAVAFEAVAAGAAIACIKRFRRAHVVAAALVALAIASERHPLDATAPMVVEAQWDRPNVPLRKHVTDCLRDRYDGDKVMVSMGSLGHYMQEASRDGFDVRDFLHEGNGDIWLAALDSPKPFAGWMLIEEKAEGGDMLAQRTREHPHFLDGYSRICAGAGLALYQRKATTEIAAR